MKSNVTSREIVSLIKEFLDKFGISVRSIDASLEGGRTDHAERYTINTSDSALLIGDKGGVLRHMEHIVREMLYTKFGQVPKIILDVNSYRRKSDNALEKEVYDICEEIRETKGEVALLPMNSYHRRIVHDIASLEPNIETRSEGEGRERRVVLFWSEG